MLNTELNKEEMGIGFVYGSAYSPILGWWAFLTGPVCAILWALGGAPGQSRAWRQIGCPVVLCGALFAITLDRWLSIPLFGHMAILSIGYGMPSTQPFDPGSALGAFFSRLFEKHAHLLQGEAEHLANLLTRGTIAFLLAIFLWPVVVWNFYGYQFGGLVLIAGTMAAVCMLEGNVRVKF